MSHLMYCDKLCFYLPVGKKEGKGGEKRRRWGSRNACEVLVPTRYQYHFVVYDID